MSICGQTGKGCHLPPRYHCSACLKSSTLYINIEVPDATLYFQGQVFTPVISLSPLDYHPRIADYLGKAKEKALITSGGVAPGEGGDCPHFLLVTYVGSRMATRGSDIGISCTKMNEVASLQSDHTCRPDGPIHSRFCSAGRSGRSGRRQDLRWSSQIWQRHWRFQILGTSDEVNHDTVWLMWLILRRRPPGKGTWASSQASCSRWGLTTVSVPCWRSRLSAQSPKLSSNHMFMMSMVGVRGAKLQSSIPSRLSISPKLESSSIFLDHWTPSRITA